jgi:hypothetical protein
MLTIALDTTAQLAVALLSYYSFDMSGYSANELINRWQKKYPIAWIRLAVIEALYQGRYKAISVQQLLAFWQRRGHALYHFNMEFERLVCSQFHADLTTTNPSDIKEKSQPSNPEPEIQAAPAAIDSQQKVETPEKANSSSTTEQQSQQQPKHQKPQLPRPPIGQFTPDKSDRTELFTSKLKAISQMGNR